MNSQICLNNKGILYILKISDNCYLFGLTKSIDKRLKHHKKHYNYEYLVHYWDDLDSKAAKSIKKNIKLYFKYNTHLLFDENNKTFNTSDIYDIIEVFNTFVDKFNNDDSYNGGCFNFKKWKFSKTKPLL